MPVFLAALGGVLINVAGSIAGQVLIALGISVITYSGVDLLLDRLKADTLSAFSGLPADLVGLLAYMKVGVAMNIIMSAVAVRMTLSGLSGVVKRFRKQ
jgi:hypothetical protein